MHSSNYSELIKQKIVKGLYLLLSKLVDIRSDCYLFDKLIENYYLVPLSSILIAIVIYGTNYWNVTNLEKKLMTNFKRIQIQIAIVVLESIFLGVFFYLVLLINKDSSQILGDLNVMSFSLALLIQALIIAFVLVVLINMIFLISAKFIFPQFDYYVEKGEPKEKWYLIRLSQKNQVLLNNRKDKFIFQDGWGGDIFFQEMREFNKIRKFLFRTESKTDTIIIVLVISSVMLYFIAFLTDISTGNSLLFYSISTLLMFLVFVLEIAKKVVFN